MTTRKRYDWQLIKDDYRTGRFSLQQLSDRHGPDKATISRRARDEGWEKDLTEQVRQRTREKVSRTALPEEAREHYPAENDEEALVEIAADENAALVRAHQGTLARWRQLSERYVELLSKQMVSEKIWAIDRGGNFREIDTPLDYVGKCMSYGAQALERFIKLERQAYGIDDDDGGETLKSFSELMAEVAPDEQA
jgi:hypothetical protein